MSETKKSSCGVVILNYNSHDLTKCLAEKVAAMHSVDEVCVVDNCSRDNFEGDFTHPKIHYIKNKVNSGYSAGNNVGLRYLVEEKECEYVFIANPDVIFENDTIEAMLLALERDGKLALVSTKHVGFNGATVHQYYEFPRYWQSVFNGFAIFRRRYERNRKKRQAILCSEPNDVVKVDAVPGCFFGIRAEFLKKNNYLYEGIFMYGEEIVLGWQAQVLGYHAEIATSASFIHNHPHSPLQDPKMFERDRMSLKLYFEKCEKIGLIKGIILSCSIFLGLQEYKVAYYLNKIRKMKLLDLKIIQGIWYRMVKAMPQMCAKILYWKALKRWPDFKHPHDLNEKINYLKFHADMNEWSRLADKYAVRDYIHERGLDSILPKLVGGVNLIP